MVFPKSNLSTSAQPWGRVVERSIGTLETLVATERVNNAARDKQAALNIERLDQSVVGLAAQQAATAANAAATAAIVNNIYKTGTTEIDGQKVATGTITVDQISTSYVYAGTINANQISAGTLTGFTVNTAASGSRVSMSGSEVVFYNSSNISAILGTSPSAFGISGFGGSFALNNGANISGNGVSLFLGNQSGSGIFSINASQTDLGGTFRRTALNGGGTTGATFSNDGSLIRTPSSIKYKQNILPLAVSYESIISLVPKSYELKDELADENMVTRTYPGFIAEELDENPELRVFVAYQQQEDGSLTPDGIHYGQMSAGLVLAIKHQDQLIKSLTSRIEALENN
jgi:hypothetical protein